jgi:hypothetical protein
MADVEGRTPAGVRLVLLLAASDGRSLDELGACARAEARTIRDRLTGSGRTVQLSLRKPDAVVAGSETGVDRSDVDAAIDVRAEDGDAMELIAAAKGLAERSNGIVAAERSVAVAGREFVVRPGQGPIQIHFCLRRVGALSAADFRALWGGEFAAEARQVGFVAGYRQVEVDPEWAQAATEATGLAIGDVDGVAVEWFANDDDFRRAVAETTAESGIVRVGRRLMDMERSLSLLSETGAPL